MPSAVVVTGGIVSSVVVVTVVVVVVSSVVVVAVVVVTQPDGPQASQQLGKPPTHALLPLRALQCAASRLTVHL
jgi:hypothetical protein